jgi:acetyl esterase/lipase
VDLRPAPRQKPKPPKYPTSDPFFYLGPLIDSYVSPIRSSTLTNPILHPILADLKHLPPKMLLIVPEIDILLDEQLKFAERLKPEIERQQGDGVSAPKRSLDIEVFEDCMHGWLGCEYIPWQRSWV